MSAVNHSLKDHAYKRAISLCAFVCRKEPASDSERAQTRPQLTINLLIDPQTNEINTSEYHRKVVNHARNTNKSSPFTLAK